MIELNNISKTYNNKTILNNINYRFKNKGLILLKGESGSGKTTLLNIISSRIKPNKGEIKIQGEIFFFSFGDYLINQFKVNELIEFHKDINNDFKEYENTFGIDSFLHKKISKLSGGEKQKLGIFLALSSNKPIILLDEPFAGIDDGGKKEIIKELKKVSKKKLIIMTSHQKIRGIIEEIILENGQLIGESSKEALKMIECKKKNTDFKKWVRILHRKQWLSKAIYVFSLLAILIMNLSINSKLNTIKDEFNSHISQEKLLYKNNIVELNNERFYEEIVIKVAQEIVDYHISVFSPSMIEEAVYVDEYYVSNGTLFSNILNDYSLKNDEIVLQIDKINFCSNNEISFCNEDNIEEQLVGKKIYFHEVEYTVINVIFFDEELIYVNDNKKLLNELEKDYKEIYRDYYLTVDNDSLNDFHEKINTVFSLLNYEFIQVSQDEKYTYFLVMESDQEYFSKEEIESFVACSDIGFSCDSFSFSILNSLMYVDNYYSEGNIKYVKKNSISSYDQIGISKGLAEVLKKNIGERIELSFYFDNHFHVLDNVYISEIVDGDDLVIYHSKYDYDLYKDKFNKWLRVKYIYGNSTSYRSTFTLGYDLVSDSSKYLNDISKIISTSIYIINLFSFIVLFIIENIKLKKIFNVLRCLYFNKVDYQKMLESYLLWYLYMGIVLFSNIYLFIIYVLVFFCFYFLSIKKIKSRLPWI